MTAQGQSKNTAAVKWLRNRTIEIVKSTELPSFLIEDQEGDTFGQRLANAFQHVFDQGYQQVIAIGNDCAELSESDLIKAAKLVNEGKAVLGPDLRNGAYLIGLDRAQFNAGQMAQLPWRSQNTFKSLVEYLGTCRILETKQDLNNLQDLQRFVRLATKKIRKTFRLLLKGIISWADNNTEVEDLTFHLAHALRGPPQRA